jgi:hypothetical protein
MRFTQRLCVKPICGQDCGRFERLVGNFGVGV